MYFDDLAVVNENCSIDQDRDSLVYILWSDGGTLRYIYFLTSHKKRYVNSSWLTIIPWLTPTAAYELIADNSYLLKYFRLYLKTTADIDPNEKEYLLEEVNKKLKPVFDEIGLLDLNIELIEGTAGPQNEFEAELVETKPKPKEQEKTSLASRLNINRLI